MGWQYVGDKISLHFRNLIWTPPWQVFCWRLFWFPFRLSFWVILLSSSSRTSKSAGLRIHRYRLWGGRICRLCEGSVRRLRGGRYLWWGSRRLWRVRRLGVISRFYWWWLCGVGGTFGGLLLGVTVGHLFAAFCVGFWFLCGSWFVDFAYWLRIGIFLVQPFLIFGFLGFFGIFFVGFGVFGLLGIFLIIFICFGTFFIVFAFGIGWFIIFGGFLDRPLSVFFGLLFIFKIFIGF